ncbi:MAG: hypothetical protein ACREKM_03620, partial [Longimicrobiales bacterium]
MKRPGMVLVLVLLAVVALELLAMSAFGFARVARLGAQTSYADAVLQAAANDAVEQAVSGVDVRMAAARPIGADWEETVNAPPGIASTARLQRLPDGFILARGAATLPRLGTASAAALVRIIEPAAILAAFPGVLTVLGVAGPQAISSPPQPECAMDGGIAPAA